MQEGGQLRLGSGSSASSKAGGLCPHYANARALYGTDIRRLPPAGEQAAAQYLSASPDVGVGMVNGSGFEREKNRDQLNGRNITRENEKVSEDMRVDIPGIMVLYSILKRKETPFQQKSAAQS
jgi:hypothetical protein